MTLLVLSVLLMSSFISSITGSDFGGGSTSRTEPVPERAQDVVSHTPQISSDSSGGAWVAPGAANVTKFPVNLTESGLPAGTKWNTTLTNASGPKSVDGKSALHVIDEANGTYTYKVISSNTSYATPDPTGTVVVNGTGVNLSFAYSPVNYTVQLFAKALPSGGTWSANLTNAALGTSQVVDSNSNSHVFNETNATYTYLISSSVPNWAPLKASGTLVVDGAGVNLTILFHWAYLIVLSESGLSPGIEWTAKLTNVTNETTGATTTVDSSNPVHEFNESNGTYSYTVSSSNPAFSTINATGTIEIVGAGFAEAFPFQELFTVRMEETGLPLATVWSVKLTNLSADTSKTIDDDTNPHVFSEPNGTFSFSVSSNNPGFGVVNSFGYFTVTGANVSRNFSFQPTYAVVVSESGLPFGTSWGVAFSNATGTGSTVTATNGAFQLLLLNGTYTYGVLAPAPGFLIRNPSGGFTVNGAALTLTPITFVQLFRLTFFQSGLPSGANWSLSLGNTTWNTTLTTTQPLLSLLEPNGTYWYRWATIASDYVPQNFSGQLTVNGSAAVVTVNYEHVGSTTWFTTTTWILLGVAAIVLAVICIVLVVRRQRRKQEPSRPAPRPWQAPENPPASAEPVEADGTPTASPTAESE